MALTGVWMWPQSVRLRGAQAVVSSCSLAGITDIFFLTKGLSGISSYPSRLVPCDDKRDLLSELLSAAHEKGIRVHAWLTSASDAHYKNLHPHSGRCHFTRGRDKSLISLSDSGYLRYMEQYVRELCSRYDIDGLHLDYIRYNHLLYGWGEENLARYAAAGADPAHLKRLMEDTFCRGEDSKPDCIFDALRAGDPHVLALANSRREDVVHFASVLTSAAKEAKPSLLLSAALMPEGAYDDTAFADLHYGQNYEDAASLYDCVLPMTLFAGSFPFTLRLTPVKIEDIQEAAAQASVRAGGDDMPAARVARTWEKEMLDTFSRLSAHEDIVVKYILLGGVPVMALPFEGFTQIGMDIRSICARKDALILGCAEELLGYLPTRDDISRGTYAAPESTFLYKRLLVVPGEAERLGEEMGHALERVLS